jgi:hypothetical protein
VPGGGVVRRNAEAIAADPALRLYGCALALLHVLAFLHWRHGQDIVTLLDPRTDPICWPFFETCHAYRVLDRAGLTAVLRGYLALALLTAALFVPRRLTRAAWWALLLLNVVKVLLLVQDYRLRLNQHYMTLWVSAAFLLLPDKRWLIPRLIVAFYVWAGVLKLDRDWLSGAALRGETPMFVPPDWVPAACAYVVVLELLVVLGLLARRAWIFWPSFAQVLMFHLVSWPIVRFFYPTLMWAILAIFPLARALPAPVAPRPSGRPVACAALALFSAVQILPWLYPGDTAVTGEGRLFALHMFDASVACRASATLHDRDGGSRTIPLNPFLPSRIHCDPIVYLGLGDGLCRRLAHDPAFADLDLVLRAGRTRERKLETIVAIDAFCRTRPPYDLWRHNAWIRSPP